MTRAISSRGPVKALSWHTSHSPDVSRSLRTVRPQMGHVALSHRLMPSLLAFFCTHSRDRRTPYRPSMTSMHLSTPSAP